MIRRKARRQGMMTKSAKSRPQRKATTTAAPNRAREYRVDIVATYLNWKFDELYTNSFYPDTGAQVSGAVRRRVVFSL